IVVVGVTLISAAAIEESFEMKEFILLHIAYLIMQIEIACVCFGISAFIKRGSIGIGLGLALAFYFMNIVCNISEQAEFLRYITPYAYAEASNIISGSELDMELIFIGAGISIAAVAVSYFRYLKKDIAS
ncbi:MAG: ABC transporter permease subunit, partial [Huintestinicola sp.]